MLTTRLSTARRLRWHEAQLRLTIGKATNYPPGARTMAPVPIDPSCTQRVDEEAATTLAYQTNACVTAHLPQVTRLHRHALHITDRATGQTRRVEVAPA